MPSPPTETRPPLRVRDLAELMHVSEDTVLRAIARGEIAANKFGRQWFIPAAEADRLAGGAP